MGKQKKCRKRSISDKIIRKSVMEVTSTLVVLTIVITTMILSLTMSSKETQLTLESESASYQLEDFFDQYTRIIDQLVVNPQIRDLLQQTTKGENITDEEGYATVLENMQNIASEDGVHQAQNIEEIRKGVEDISGAVQDISATAEESSATSEELAAQAFTLNELIQRFDLGE